MIRRFISTILKLIPFESRAKIKHSFNIPNMEWSLMNLKTNGFYPEHILDIGAYEGEWTKLVKKIWPDSKVLMIEPLSHKSGILSQLCKQYNNSVDYIEALLGDVDDQEVYFKINETASSVLSEHFSSAKQTIKMTTKKLDSIVISGTFEFIKLDTQGYEMSILKGGEKTIRNTEVILMEISLIDIHVGVPLIKDVLNQMDLYDFQLYDICSFIRRPLDHALWQIDGIFVRKDSKLISSKRWA